MTKSDAVFLASWLALAAALMGGFLFSTTRTAGNFGDVAAYHVPLRELVASRLQAGQLPFWNPYIFGGEPLWANPQAGLFYPLSALFDIWPTIPALNWSLFLHAALALLGMQLLARRAGLSAPGAAALAAAYGFSSFLLCRLPQGVPTLLYGLAYVPWTWLFFDRPVLLAVTFALQFLSGHPQFMGANLLGLALVLAVARPAKLPAFLAAGAWALAIVAAQLLPTLQFLSRSVRVEWSTIFKTGYSLPVMALGTLVLPDMIGNPMQGTSAVPPSVFFEMFNLYLSLGVLALAAAGLAKGGWRRPALLLGLGLFLALGEANPAYRWLSHAPPIGWVRAPSRFVLVFLWGLLLAALRGWRWASPRAPDWRWRAALVAVIAADLALWGRHLVYSQDAAPLLAPNHELMAPLQLDALHRAATAPDVANPNKMMLYRVRNATGYEAFYPAPAASYTSRAQGRAAADPSRTYITRLDLPGMEQWGVKYLLDAPNGAARVTDDPDARPLAYLDNGTPIQVDRADAERWRARYRSGEGGMAILTEAKYPGWTAWLDGRRVRLEGWNDFMMGVAVPQGEGRIDLLFRPTLWVVWAALSLAGLGALASWGRAGLEG